LSPSLRFPDRPGLSKHRRLFPPPPRLPRPDLGCAVVPPPFTSLSAQFQLQCSGNTPPPLIESAFNLVNKSSYALRFYYFSLFPPLGVLSYNDSFAMTPLRMALVFIFSFPFPFYRSPPWHELSFSRWWIVWRRWLYPRTPFTIHGPGPTTPTF